jgi:hypothetical protein
MIAVEAFSKHLELVPIVNKEAATVAYAFLHHVIRILTPDIDYDDPAAAATRDLLGPGRMLSSRPVRQPLRIWL